MTTKLRIYFFFFVLCFSFIFFIAFKAINNYEFFNSYKNLQKNSRVLPTYRQLDGALNNFDISKSLIRRGNYQDINAVNLSLSYNDIKVFRDYYLNAINEYGFLIDEGNEWRKAKINLPNVDEKKIKIKIHGTSPTPIIKSVSYVDDFSLRLKNKIFKVLQINQQNQLTADHIDITKRGFAFKIKLKDGEVYNGMRRLNFLSPHDDWKTSTNALNKYIQSHGVITTTGSYKNLFINGTDIGLYLVIENIDKYLLERNFKITNYAILKNNDDWSKAWKSHYARTMQTSYDIEQKGEPETAEIALFQIKRLFQAINNSDFQTIVSLIDVENLANLYALMILTGDFHPVGGDNLKYIYNFATGTFQFAYRIEGRPRNIIISNDELRNQTGQNLLIEKLASQPWFRDITYKYLEKILRNEFEIYNLLEKEYELFEKIAKKSRHQARDYYFYHIKDLEIIKSNLKIIKNITPDHLNFLHRDELQIGDKKKVDPAYLKAFLTVEKTYSGNYIDILNDSTNQLIIKSVFSCDGEQHQFEKNNLIMPSSFDNKSGLIKNNNVTKYKIPFSCINSAEIFNAKNEIKINNKDIYINYSKPIKIITESGLEQFGQYLFQTKNQDNRSYRLVAGDYLITDDVIFPPNAKVTFEPGVKISVSKNISIYIRGDFSAEGTKNKPIIVKNINNQPFGSFAIKGKTIEPAMVSIKNFYLDGGSETIIDGTYFSSQFSVHIANVNIKNSFFKNSFSDDGVNIKNSIVEIHNNVFEQNSADQVDLDFVNGNVTNNKFSFIGAHNGKFTDGLDISGSVLNIHNNLFLNMSDKGLSVGEKSKANIYSNTIQKNNIGIALKDASEICLKNNTIIENSNNILRYIKKNMYSEPNLYVENQDGLNAELDINKCAITSFL